MTEISIQVKGAELVKKGLENLADEIPKISAGRIYGRMQAARTRLRKYPPQSNKKQPFKTDRQRKFFFAALKDGRIKVPYQRTRTLANGWEIKKTPGSGRQSVGYMLANQTPYTQLVHGDARGTGQADYHRGNWKPVRDVFDEVVKELPQEIEDNIQMVARRMGF